MLKRIDYQETAVSQLVIKTQELLEYDRKPVLVLKAPTGSGKTVITAKYIRELINQTEEDLCFLWVSIGTAKLHIQSKDKLRNIFQGSPSVSLANEEFFGYRSVINKFEVVVVNWEAINAKDSHGNYKNVLMKDSGERFNFRQVLQNTRYAGRKIVLIIDESHTSATTERAKELKDEIQASLTFEMSATPKLLPTIEDREDNKGDFVRVKVEDVISEQMIKKEIVINENFENSDVDTIDDTLLQLAHDKRLEIKGLLEAEGSNVNPLVIIQLPNMEEGEEKKGKILNYLDKKGINKANGKVATWLHEDPDKDMLKDISNNTNEIEFLLFKQAVATGWDCPRAHILLRFREVQSFVFEKQVLGRILRMPEQKHYSNDLLNRAFVYTDFTGNVLTIIDEDFDYPKDRMNDINLYKNSDYALVYLSKEYKVKKRSGLKSEFAKNIFQDLINANGLTKSDYSNNRSKLEAKGFRFDIDNLNEEIIGQVEVATVDLLSEETTFKGDAKVINLDEERIETYFRRILRAKAKSIGNDRNSVFEILRNEIYTFHLNYVFHYTETDVPIIDIQKSFLLNYMKGNFFNKLIDDIINIYKKMDPEEIFITEHLVNNDYKIPETITVNRETNEQVQLQKYYYEPCYLQKDRTNPEKHFESFIMSNLDKIEFWVKNGDRGTEYFSILYELNEEKHEFYPDYIVKFNDGRIGIFEAKDPSDDSDETTAKAERLQEYIQDQNKVSMVNVLFGGVVANFGSENVYIRINMEEQYTLEYGEWQDLESIIC